MVGEISCPQVSKCQRKQSISGPIKMSKAEANPVLTEGNFIKP